VDKVTTGKLYAQLGGGLAALVISAIVCGIGCVVKPMNFDWNIMYTGITLVEDCKVLGDNDPDGTPEALFKAKSWIFQYGVGYSLFLCVIWPLLCVPLGAFGKSSFQIWCAVALMWGWMAALIIIWLPIYESSDGVIAVLMCKKPTSSTTATTAVEGVAVKRVEEQESTTSHA
jgi:hypothetical protein